MNFKKIFSAVAAAAMLTACVGDLNTIPLNPTDVTSETAYGADEQGYVQGLAKIYFQLTSNNTQDLQVADGGASEFIRAFWSTQEVTADAAKCAWGDAWVNDLNNCTWKGDVLNDAVYAVYVRTLQGIAYVNEYLRQTSNDNLDLRGCSDAVKAKVQQFRAEARFLRAYFYWAAMDTFGQVPFSTENTQFGGGYNPPQKPAAEIFDFIVDELEDLASEGSAMPAAQSNYPRADKGSVLGLLARVYLNAEVYAGKEMWAEAKATCEKIYGLGYALAPTHAELFRGDNGENADAKKEMLFAASYDAESNQSYGGTTYLTLSTLSGDDGLSTSPVSTAVGQVTVFLTTMFRLTSLHQQLTSSLVTIQSLTSVDSISISRVVLSQWRATSIPSSTAGHASSTTTFLTIWTLSTMQLLQQQRTSQTSTGLSSVLVRSTSSMLRLVCMQVETLLHRLRLLLSALA